MIISQRATAVSLVTLVQLDRARFNLFRLWRKHLTSPAACCCSFCCGSFS
eukprot:m.351564 g.351564  ORF g.351564 m.351564 type:complete len:50 (-) comp16275_c0_seq1:1034-1183(-)